MPIPTITGSGRNICQSAVLRVPLILPREPAVGADHCVAIDRLFRVRLAAKSQDSWRPYLVGLCRKQVEGERYAVSGMPAVRNRRCADSKTADSRKKTSVRVQLETVSSDAAIRFGSSSMVPMATNGSRPRGSEPLIAI